MTDQSWQPLPIPDLASAPRLDRALADALHLSRRDVWRLLDQHAVRIDGRPVCAGAKGRRLTPHDHLEVRPFVPPHLARPIPNPDLPLNEILATDHLLVLDKPPGIPVHPLRPDEIGTLLNAVIARYPRIFCVGEGGLRSGIVHRLDVTTSGAVVMALDPPTWQQLRHAFSAHLIRKQYRALVRGSLIGRRREQMNLTIAQHRPARVRVLDPHESPSKNTRSCALTWQADESFDNATLLTIELETGFLHQIRAMLAHRGHPLLGDTLYDPSAPITPLATRPMLHARRLDFADLHAHCSLPHDFQSLLTTLRTPTTPTTSTPTPRTP